MQEVLQAKYYIIHETKQERYFVQTTFQTRTGGTVFTKVHGIDKGVNPSLWQKYRH